MSRQAQRGMTLIELIAAITIVSIATFGLMLAISSVVGSSADPMVRRQAGAIAEAYLEEVTQAAFCDPDFVAAAGVPCRQACTVSACGACGGPGAGLQEASRDLYDDVCDYAGLGDAGASDRNGNPLPGLGRYDVSVSVTDAGVSLGAPALSADSGEVVRIDVTVSHVGLENDVVLSAWRANTR
ncbi:MAG: type IV pilus modification PilV family protein [Gammaproteobacteria bacterium]